MGKTFSQRMGFKPVKDIIQVNSIDADLRNSIWNDVYTAIYEMGTALTFIDFPAFLQDIWKYYFKEPIDGINVRDIGNTMQLIRVYFFQCKWYEVYDFIQFIVEYFPVESLIQNFIQTCNATLSRELSAYRFVENKLVPVTSEQEIAEIEAALAVSKRFTPHLECALEFLADRKTPDYRNSIKESICAVEAICKLITGNSKATLGEALRLLENKLGKLHPSLKNTFNSLYGYTSDAEGIRHGMLGESSLDVEDAKFMLIACSAFINYLVAKAAKAGLQLKE